MNCCARVWRRSRRGGTHRVLSLGAHQPGLQHVQGLAQEGGTATLRRNGTVTSRHVKGRAAPGGRERPITYGDEAGQEVCEYVVAHDSRSQDQLLGLVVAGQLKGRGNNNEGRGHLNRDQEQDCEPERKMVLRTTPLSRATTLEMGGAAQTLLLCRPFCFPLIVVAMGEAQTEGTAF